MDQFLRFHQIFRLLLLYYLSLNIIKLKLIIDINLYYFLYLGYGVQMITKSKIFSRILRTFFIYKVLFLTNFITIIKPFMYSAREYSDSNLKPIQ